MTEAEWRECEDLKLMLTFLTHGRKERLFAYACCRRLSHLFVDGRSRWALEVSLRHADGQAGLAELRAAVADAYEAGEEHWHKSEDLRSAVAKGLLAAELAAREALSITHVVSTCQEAVVREGLEAAGDPEGARVAEERWQCGLLRDILGTPFRPAAILPTPRPSTVASLAQVAYAEPILPGGQLDALRLAVLADALEEIGCTEPAILEHLRGPGPHVRGCWPVDLILAKE